MPDNTILNPGAGGDTIAADEVGSVKYQIVKLDVGGDGVSTPVVGALPVSGTFFQATQPVSGTVTANTGLSQPLTDAQLRATAVPISGTVTANTGLTQPLTDTQLRATAVPISGTVTANTGLSQPLTDAQLRATAVPISGTVTANTGFTQPLTDAQLRATSVPVSGPLTDAQLRATAVPISGPVTANTGLSQPLTDAQLRATAVPVSGPLTDTQLRAVSVDTAPTGVGADYWPGYSPPPSTAPQTFTVDPSGAFITRGAVTTDEGTFRANFANTSLAVSIGAVTVSGSTVTGTGFSAVDVHTNDYFKLAADAESTWTQIESVVSDTEIALASAYTGAASGTGNRALVQPFTGSGGTLTVGSGVLTLGGGTTTSAITGVKRLTDYAPLIFRSRLSISQRIANQEIHIGLEENAPVTRWFARFLADGTTDTTIKCESGRNPTDAPSASETETVTVTLPNGATTAALLDYRIELLTETVRFYVQGVLLAENTRVMPSQFDEMTSHVEIRNGTAPASNTNVVVDFMTGKNHNKLEIGVMSEREQIVATAVPLQPFSYSVAGVITINTNLIVLDCLQLRSLFIQCTSMGTTGVVTVQWANDAAFTAPITATLISESGATSTTFNAAVLRATNVIARYCRLRLTTATTAGTTTINVWGNQTPIVPVNPTVQGTITANIGTGSLAAGTNAIGDVGIQYRANATGAATTFKFASAATVNNVLILTGARRLLGWNLTNTTASFKYFRIYNKATAPTSGESPTFMFGLPPNSTTVSPPIVGGIGLSLGLGIACTGGVADTDATVTAANDVVGSIFYV